MKTYTVHNNLVYEILCKEKIQYCSCVPSYLLGQLQFYENGQILN